MKKKYWFKRREYGWGWQPATSEGWLTTLFFIAATTANFTVGLDIEADLPAERMLAFGLLVTLFILIMLKTGEKPKWQWGKKKK